MHSPNVSGALTYKELVMEAKNEERRQSELIKRKQYQNAQQRSPTSPFAASKKLQTPSSSSADQPRQTNSDSPRKYCNFCHKPGHLRRDCSHRIKSESTGNGLHCNRSSNTSYRANTKTVQTSSPEQEQMSRIL